MVGTPEFLEVLDALMYNIVHSNLLASQPTGGYISFFLETEMSQLSERAQEIVLSIYQWHRRALLSETSGGHPKFTAGT